MVICTRLSDWWERRRALRRDGLTFGFVPTMGSLHEGHRSLVERSGRDNDCTLVSIFVNPTQFDDPSDLERYPRTPDADLALLEAAGVTDVLFPDPGELYADDYRYRVVETRESRTLDGVERPGHFTGVLTVVLKLLNIASADRAYFGEKDWQQLGLVTGMVDAFHIPTSIIGCPTVREADGLACSSRNRLLSAGDRARAPIFHQVLSSAPTIEAAREALTAAGFDVDYVENVGGRWLGAVRVGGVRLIDNVAR